MPAAKTAILLIDCPDRKGIVVTIVNFLVNRYDELVLESATNGHADAIITYNIADFLPAAKQFGLRILTPGVIIKERFSQWSQRPVP